MSKGDWTTPSNINNYSTLHIEHNWEDLCIHLEINKHALMMSITK